MKLKVITQGGELWCELPIYIGHQNDTYNIDTFVKMEEVADNVIKSTVVQTIFAGVVVSASHGKPMSEYKAKRIINESDFNKALAEALTQLK